MHLFTYSLSILCSCLMHMHASYVMYMTAIMGLLVITACHDYGGPWVPTPRNVRTTTAYNLLRQHSKFTSTTHRNHFDSFQIRYSTLTGVLRAHNRKRVCRVWRHGNVCVWLHKNKRRNGTHVFGYALARHLCLYASRRVDGSVQPTNVTELHKFISTKINIYLRYTCDLLLDITIRNYLEHTPTKHCLQYLDRIIK